MASMYVARRSVISIPSGSKLSSWQNETGPKPQGIHSRKKLRNIKPLDLNCYIFCGARTLRPVAISKQLEWIGRSAYILAWSIATALHSDINQTSGSGGHLNMWENRCMRATVCLLRAGWPTRAGDAAKSGQFIGQLSWVTGDSIGLKGLRESPIYRQRRIFNLNVYISYLPHLTISYYNSSNNRKWFGLDWTWGLFLPFAHHRHLSIARSNPFCGFALIRTSIEYGKIWMTPDYE